MSSTAATSRLRDVYSIPVRSTPNTSYSPTVTSSGHQPKLNVVTRVAIEGKAKQDKDGASIRMYLKISIPFENVQPGTTIALFPEENVKILTSQVHPLDNQSVPYNFSSTVCPLLHNAARALNLPARSTESFNRAFSLSPTSSHSVSDGRTSKTINGSPATGTEIVTPVDNQYTGHILVSGYHISYVLPKVFLTRPSGLSETESESLSRSSHRHRRATVGDRGSAQFMAAIDLWIPYISRPPRSPYLLSIPIPRCLQNNIKLRIFQPTAAAASFASLSSIEEDGASWELTSDPHVTRTTSSRPFRSNSYTHFADDESSDSSTVGFMDGCGIQGTFPSAEHIRVRWAKPSKNIDVPGGVNDGRRRVGVKEVKGEMTCTVRGKSKAKERNGVEGLLMDVEYKGTCKGVWFPGVATLLGMDVSLETKGSDVYWVDGSPGTWEVNGGIGYTGFDIGPGRPPLQSQTDPINSNPSSQDSHLSPPSRTNSSSSTSSLLRAPLPAQNVAEYSFEGSTTTLSSSSPLDMSSVPSLAPASMMNSINPRPELPGVPITLHVNINEIIPPTKKVFIFTISGSILVVARPTLSRLNAQSSQSSSSTHSGTEDDEPDPDPIVLPRFTVLAADSESTFTIIRNEVDGSQATIEVYNPTGDIYRDAQAKKTVLQKGGYTKCSDGGSRIAFRSIGFLNGVSPNRRAAQPPSRPRTPMGSAVVAPDISPAMGRTVYHPRPQRDGPLLIPSVEAFVTALLYRDGSVPPAYAVRLCLNAPAETDSGWLEFGLAQRGAKDTTSLGAKDNNVPKVTIVSATVEGIPVKHSTIAMAKHEENGLGAQFEKMNDKTWINWVKVHVGIVGGSAVVIEYVVSEEDEVQRKSSARREVSFQVLLPSFSIPVGRLEVNVDGFAVNIISLQSNFLYQQSTNSGQKLLSYSMDKFYYPQLSMTISPSPRTHTFLKGGALILATWVLIVASLLGIYRLGNNLQSIGQAVDTWSTVPEPSTITRTVYANDCTKWFSNEVTVYSNPITPPVSTTILATSTSKPTDMHITTTPLPNVADRDDDTTDDDGVLSSTTSSEPIAEHYALGKPISHILNFSLPTHNFHFKMEDFMRTLDKVWHLFRKAYHYPLDPT